MRHIRARQAPARDQRRPAFGQVRRRRRREANGSGALRRLGVHSSVCSKGGQPAVADGHPCLRGPSAMSSLALSAADRNGCCRRSDAIRRLLALRPVPAFPPRFPSLHGSWATTGPQGPVPRGLPRALAEACGSTNRSSAQPPTGFPSWTREFDSRHRLVEGQNLAQQRLRALRRGVISLTIAITAGTTLYQGRGHHGWLVISLQVSMLIASTLDLGGHVRRFLRLGRETERVPMTPTP